MDGHFLRKKWNSLKKLINNIDISCINFKLSLQCDRDYKIEIIHPDTNHKGYYHLRDNYISFVPKWTQNWKTYNWQIENIIKWVKSDDYSYSLK